MSIKKNNSIKRKCPLLGGSYVPIIYCEIAPCFSDIGVLGCKNKERCNQSLIGWSSVQRSD